MWHHLSSDLGGRVDFSQGELASYINLQIKETQSKKTLQHLRAKVTGLSDLTQGPSRKLVKEGQVYLKNVKKLYQVMAESQSPL